MICLIVAKMRLILYCNNRQSSNRNHLVVVVIIRGRQILFGLFGIYYRGEEEEKKSTQLRFLYSNSTLKL
jgi:hypothetical protein